MQADPIFTGTKMMATSSPDRIKESFLECIGMLSGSTVSFVMKVDGSEGKVVRATIPSLVSIRIPMEGLPEDVGSTMNRSRADLGPWLEVQAFSDGRLNSVILRRFEVGDIAYIVGTAGHDPEPFSSEAERRFSWTVPFGEQTIRVTRNQEQIKQTNARHQEELGALRERLEVTRRTSDELEGANAQLANALLEVSSAKAQSKALLVTVALGIVLFGISEFRIEPWLEASGVSPTALVYQKVLILGGLVPIQVVLERVISTRLYSSASKVRIDMYAEVLTAMLEDGILTDRELRWLELYRRQQGVTKDEAQAVEAMIRSEMLLKRRSSKPSTISTTGIPA